MTASGNDVFPQLKTCAKLTDEITLFDVKFYPYSVEDDDQIFAVTGGRDTVVCQPRLGADPSFEILRIFRDEDPESSYNSLVWTKDPVSSKPLLCIAGEHPKHIKILDIEKAKAVRTLPGHGKGINDLAISPLSTSLLASGAEDSTIRLWNLEPKYKQQPCIAMFSGEGHRAPVLAIHFHPNGRWLLSGGIDTAVCLWAVPSLDELERNENSGKVPEPMIVYYPHFFTKELHPNYVDCFGFYDDLIFSKAARNQDGKDAKANNNEILLWRIDGFDSEDEPPSEPPIPEPGKQTRSSFPHDEDYRGFHRLLTFSIPHTDRFYHRFGLYHPPDARPILCMGNQESKYLFWDLQRLEEGIAPQDRALSKQKRKKGGVKKSGFLSDLRRGDSATASSSSRTPEASTTTTAEEKEYMLGDRFTPLEPHYSVTTNTRLSQMKHFATSQIDWSPDGTWMVGVGDLGMICMFHRDKSVVAMGAGQNGAQP